MIVSVLLILILLWMLGFLTIPLTGIVLFRVLGRSITLNDLLIFLVLVWLLDLLPSPFREIASVLFLLWILGSLGIIAIPGFSNLVVFGLIVGLFVYLWKFTSR